jgi:hypothetical protein
MPGFDGFGPSSPVLGAFVAAAAFSEAFGAVPMSKIQSVRPLRNSRCNKLNHLQHAYYCVLKIQLKDARTELARRSSDFEVMDSVHVAISAIQCAEVVIVLIDGLPPNGTKCSDLRKKLDSLLESVRPLAAIADDASEFTLALDQLKSLLFAVEKFVQSISHLIADGVEDGLDIVIAAFIVKIDSSMEEIKALEKRRSELLRQEEEFQNILQHQYVENPPMEDAYDGRSLISQGCFGGTYRMVDMTNGQTYAVKRLRLAALTPQGVAISTLAQECKALQALVHSNVARNVKIFLSREGRFFNIAMELVDGEALTSKIVCTPAPTECKIVEWVQQIASALSYMHRKGVLHRDLKPENVVLTRAGEIKLVGFQLPCLVSAAVTFTVYTSFERTAGVSYDGRDDVWAVGCILLEVLTRARLVPETCRSEFSF